MSGINLFIAQAQALPPLIEPQADVKYPGWSLKEKENKLYQFRGVAEDEVTILRKLPMGCFELDRWKQLAFFISTLVTALLFSDTCFQKVEDCWKELGLRVQPIKEITKKPVYQESSYPDLSREREALDLIVNRGLKALKEQHHKAPLIKEHFFSPVLMGEKQEKPFHQTLVQHKFFGQLERHQRLGMAGIAYIAAYLKDKHEELRGLYVCETLNALKERLEEIDRSPKDTRQALVVPVAGYFPEDKEMSRQQHKVTLCVEKRDGYLKIAVLDAQPTDFNSSLLNQTIEELRLNSSWISEKDVLFWTIFQARLQWDHTEIFHHLQTRQHANGCGVFALRDAVSFLRCLDFFARSGKENTITPIRDKGAVSLLNRLPPEFMKGTQSVSQIKKYTRENSDLSQSLFQHKKNDKWNLEQCLQAHKIVVKRPEKQKPGTACKIHPNLVDTEQNYYISLRSYKYHEMAVKALEQKTDSELLEKIKPVLLKSSKCFLNFRVSDFDDL